MNVNIINKSNNQLPAYQTEGAAGMDLRANLETPIIVAPKQRVLVPTGIFLEIPVGYEGQVRPRSGLAIKNGITVLNAPGTVDSDYRGEVKVILINLGENDFVVNHGDRIAQIVFAKCETACLTEVDDLSSTERGEGGFNSTGNK